MEPKHNNSQPRVLVVSHNAFSETSSMGKTLALYFSYWDSKKVAQLFFHSENPNSPVCKKFFRITDFDVLASLFRDRDKVGEELTEETTIINSSSTRIDSGVKRQIYEFGRKKLGISYFLRNNLWKFNRWNNKALQMWLNKFDPEVVFFAAGDYSFSFDIALEIARSRSIPLILCFFDDYYLSRNKTVSPFYWLDRFFYIRKFDDAIQKAAAYFVISDQMGEVYSRIFNKTGHVIMTPSSFPVEHPTNKSSRLKISYIGNLGLSRWKPLVEIGQVLKARKWNGQNLNIDVYSNEENKNIINRLNPSNGIIFHGKLNKSQVVSAIQRSSILLHVECLDKDVREKTRFSISTKIADSLASGRCIFAYGPEDVASIEYLKKNCAACVATSTIELQKKLPEILFNQELQHSYIENALKLAQKRHNPNKNAQYFGNIIDYTVRHYQGENNENITDK